MIKFSKLLIDQTHVYTFRYISSTSSVTVDPVDFARSSRPLQGIVIPAEKEEKSFKFFPPDDYTKNKKLHSNKNSLLKRKSNKNKKNFFMHVSRRKNTTTHGMGEKRINKYQVNFVSFKPPFSFAFTILMIQRKFSPFEKVLGSRQKIFYCCAIHMFRAISGI